jgi:DNA processing protein
VIPDTLLRLAINRLALRPAEKLGLEDLVDSEVFFRALTPSLLSHIVGRSVTHMEVGADQLLLQAERDMRYLTSRGCHALSLRDRRYPALLREIYDPPYLLYVRGVLPAGTLPSVAIVGTRDPGVAAVIAARELARGLAAAGITVVSGLARGIDVAAHQGAVEAGTSAAVLASGVDLITPSANRHIAAAILDRGGYLASEYAPGVPPLKYHFPARNRIISGVARGVVVVQAPAKSGALITADYALDQGRDLFVHRDGLEGMRGAGSAELAADGAMIVGCADDILAEWGLGAAADAGVAFGGCSAAACGPDTEAHTTTEAARRRIELVRRSMSGEATR